MFTLVCTTTHNGTFSAHAVLIDACLYTKVHGAIHTASIDPNTQYVHADRNLPNLNSLPALLAIHKYY